MLKKVFFLAATAGLLSGCADHFDVQGAAALPNQGGAFEKALHAEYAALAQDEQDEADWRDSAYFIVKSEAAARGETVLPSDFTERAIAADKAAELKAAREMLMARLDGGARTEHPVTAAHAQVAGFDCWMQEQEEGHQPDDIAACRAVFEAAMKELQPMAAPAVAKAEVKQPMPTPMPAPFIVYFATGSASFSPEAMEVFRSAANAWRDNKSVTVMIDGHADTVGDTTSNIRLSQQRAEAVVKALTEAGVSAAMPQKWYGEDQPRVETPDSTSEQANRRVEITFRK